MNTDQFDEDYSDLTMCLSRLKMDSSNIDIDYRYLVIHSRNWSMTLGTLGLTEDVPYIPVDGV